MPTQNEWLIKIKSKYSLNTYIIEFWFLDFKLTVHAFFIYNLCLWSQFFFVYDTHNVNIDFMVCRFFFVHFSARVHSLNSLMSGRRCQTTRGGALYIRLILNNLLHPNEIINIITFILLLFALLNQDSWMIFISHSLKSLTILVRKFVLSFCYLFALFVFFFSLSPRGWWHLIHFNMWQDDRFELIKKNAIIFHLGAWNRIFQNDRPVTRWQHS